MPPVRRPRAARWEEGWAHVVERENEGDASCRAEDGTGQGGQDLCRRKSDAHLLWCRRKSARHRCGLPGVEHGRPRHRFAVVAGQRTR